MSSSSEDTPSPNTISWALWHGLDALAGYGCFPSDMQPEGINVAPPAYITESQRVMQALTQSNPVRRYCAVPGCRTIRCNLATHRNYDPTPRRRAKVRRKLGKRAHLAWERLQQYSQGDPSCEGVDGFPALPIEGTLDSDMRAHFHYFFANTFDKLAQLFRGPSVANLPDFKNRMLATALHYEVYCQALILSARTEQDVAAGNCCETKQALGIYNKTLTVLRTHLNVVHSSLQPLQIELALLVLCILMVDDVAHGREEASRLHWQGLRDLVALRGGMHCVTMALAYVIHVDREWAVRYDEFPTYSNASRVPLPMPVLAPSSLRHGGKFAAMNRNSTRVDAAVLNYLIDTAALVELWEEWKTPSTVSQNMAGFHVSAAYLHYLRDQLDERFTVLNAQWSRIDSIERCLLWTARVIEYPCTWSTYIHSFHVKLCHKLGALLQSQTNILERWHADSDEVAWILFTVSAVVPSLAMHSWTVEYLRRLLDSRHGQPPWPRTWQADEQEILLDFVWSGPQYAARFESVCKELEQRRNGGES